MLLNYLDSAIGFIVVILMFSLVITILVQMVGVLLQLRGKSLLRGVELLFHEIDPDLKSQAKALADQVLRHPAIAEDTKRLASALQSHELKLVLQSLAEAADANPQLKKALDERRATVFGRIDDWFELVMDRAGERFKMNTRWATTVFAVILAFALQLDSISLFRQIATNADLRARLVSMSDSVSETSKKVLESPAVPNTEQGLKELTDRAAEVKAEIEKSQLQLVPNPWRLSAFDNIRSFLGLILTIFLLGLGAPFWFKALQNLVGLRHAVDQKKDQDEEAERAALAAKK
ncbi:MAG: hypothetical protein ABJC13_13175 [Acidobacteriota bacterium]